MKRFLYPVIACVLLLCAPACEIHFDLDKISEAKMYVQYLPSPESSVMMIAYAEPAYGKEGEVSYDFSGSSLSVNVNGKAADIRYPSSEEIDENGWFNYGGNCRIALAQAPSELKSGDVIDLALGGKDVKTAHARTVIPPKPSIVETTFERVEMPDSSEAVRVTVKLDKAVDDGEYYGLKAVVKTTTITAHTPYIYTDGDNEEEQEEGDKPFTKAFPFPIPDLEIDTLVVDTYIFPGQLATTSDLNSLDLDAFANIQYTNGLLGEISFSSEPMVLLGSKMFDSDSYSFYINSLDGSAFTGSVGIDFTPDDLSFLKDWDGESPIVLLLGGESKLQLEVFRLSEELYNYCKAQYLGNFNMLSNLGLSPPNFTYTNVHDGIGIVGGLNGTRSEWFNLTELLAK
ncbi:MAG: DUF4249 family protein [Bacteroidales bacterium]|nr:DUF4249 family protein [Bacteroidales bacterium]